MRTAFLRHVIAVAQVTNKTVKIAVWNSGTEGVGVGIRVGEFEGDEDGLVEGWLVGDAVGVVVGDGVGVGVGVVVDAKVWNMVVASLDVPSWFSNPSSKVKSSPPLLL